MKRVRHEKHIDKPPTPFKIVAPNRNDILGTMEAKNKPRAARAATSYRSIKNCPSRRGMTASTFTRRDKQSRIISIIRRLDAFDRRSSCRRSLFITPVYLPINHRYTAHQSRLKRYAILPCRRPLSTESPRYRLTITGL